MNASEITALAMSHGAAQKAPELEQLVKLLLKRQPRTVLEIGTMDGGTLSAWCQCATVDATVISVDLPGGEWGGGYGGDRAEHIRGFATGRQNLVLIQGDSHAPDIRDRVLWELDGRNIDFLFIDGDHSLAGVSNDFADYSTLVRQGGMIALHDIVDHTQERTVQVAPLWANLKTRFRHVEITVAGHERSWGPWGGIGVIWL